MTRARIIPSEQQAEEVGRRYGDRDRDFIVFWYEQAHTRLTLFGVEIVATGRRIWTQPAEEKDERTCQPK